jgi:two-component system, sensor histidine kinase PdtaS
MSTSAFEGGFQFPLGNAIGDARVQKQRDALKTELIAAHAREVFLLREMRELSTRQEMMVQEFEHRLVNGLQLVVSLLSLQSRTATTPEASMQLTTAARRVAALGRVHHRLHVLDHQNHVEFRQYLQHLCEDLSGLLFQERAGHAIVVEGAAAEIPTVFAIPLGFIVNELVTNAAKYAEGNIVVRFEAVAGGHALSVMDQGPGLRSGFDPARSKGLGMRIILSLVKQIGATLRFDAGDGGRGTCFTVAFTPPPKINPWTRPGDRLIRTGTA